MTYSAFCEEQQKYLDTVTPQGTTESIPHFTEKNYGETYTTKLLNSDAIQEHLDIMRARAEALEIPFNEAQAKEMLISRATGDVTKEIRMEYDRFISTKDPQNLIKNLSKFYGEMTDGKNLIHEIYEPENEEKIKLFLGVEDLKDVSNVERATALTALKKKETLMKTADLRNTNTMAQYHVVTVENKSANPLGFYSSRIELLPEETQKKLRPLADKLLPVTHDGGLWHEMTHTLGTENESFCESFRFLKTLKEYGTADLLLPDINARLYNNMNTLETIRTDELQGRGKTLQGNFTYLMPKMMKHILENASTLGDEIKGMSDADLMKKTIEIAQQCAYSEKTENAFRDMAKTCHSSEELALKMQEVYKNGANDPMTGAVYPLAKDMLDTARFLDPNVTPESFFQPKNFESQSRNLGKEKIEKKEIQLSEEEKKHYQDLYKQTKQNNPDATNKEFKALFAEAIVKDAWARKAAEEAKLEDPKQAADILFSKEKTEQMTNTINTCLTHAKNAAGIVQTYDAEFSKNYTEEKRKETGHKSLMQTLSNNQKRQHQKQALALHQHHAKKGRAK